MCKIGRAFIVIDYKNLQSEINLVESQQEFNTYGELCKAVSDYDAKLQPSGCAKNSKHVPRTIHPNQVYLAIKDALVTVKTEKGKRGRTVGNTVTRTSKSNKFASNITIVNALKDIDEDTPEQYKGLVDKVKSGSMKAAFKLKCLRCTGFTGAHKICNAQVCDLLPFNLLFWPNRGNEEKLTYDPLNKLK